MTNLSNETWFTDPALQRLFALLNADGGEARVAGGAVRNSLMGLPVADIDLATTLPPETVMERAKAAGIKAVPTGIDHGTVTLVLDGRGFEVTTLRRDVETDGRRAKVAFGEDWQEDAERRDLTINALYVGADGEVIDLIGGLPDVETKTVRFIGDADTRIAEDYLRILRFFRFFAHYGGGRPDPAGLKACSRAKDKLDPFGGAGLGGDEEALSARDPGRALCGCASPACSGPSCPKPKSGVSTRFRPWSPPSRRSDGSRSRCCGSLRSCPRTPSGWRPLRNGCASRMPRPLSSTALPGRRSRTVR
jgi:poly(A) polymerase